MRVCPILSVVLASACILPPVSLAQAPESNTNSSPVPVIQANTRAVVVDVVVTRGRDEPVTSLHKQDFQVLEDGKTQPIDFFEEHTAVAAPQNIPLVPMPPHVYTNVPSAPLSDSVNVLLLDSLNTPRTDQAYIHQQILEFIRTMKPATRVAIFTLGSRLRFIQGFTDDPALLQAAIDNKNFGFKSTTTNVNHSRSDDDADKSEVAAKEEAFGGARGAGTAGVAALQSAQSDYAEFQTDQRVAITLGALQFLGRYLAAIPGRKNLIWFASSYPIYFFPKSTEKQPFNLGREYTDEIKRTADLMTLSKVAVYPIDAEGLMNDHAMDAEHDLAAAGGGGALLRNTMEGASQRTDTISAMEQIAADTGGEAIFNTNDLNGALNRAINNGAHYYTLVYTPANKTTDGQFRHIDIKLDQSKCKLSYRRGYYADDVAREVIQSADRQKLVPDPNPAAKLERITASDVLQPLLMRGMPSVTELLYGVRVVAAPTQPAPGAKPAGFNTRISAPTTRYSADFLIDWKKVQLASAPNGVHTGRLRVELIAYDRDGKVLNWAEQLMGLNFDAQTYAAIQRSGIPAHIEIDIPQTEVYLATGIYDPETSKAGTLEIPIDNRAAPKVQASVTSPAAR